jgi:hypothetical protein
LLLRNLFANSSRLRPTDSGIFEIRLRRCECSASGFDATLPGGDSRGLLIGGCYGLLSLAFRHSARLCKARIGVSVKNRQLIGSFLLRKVGLGRRQIGFGLPHASRCIGFSLFRLQLVLVQLLFENGNLISRRFFPGFCPGYGAASLLFAGADLLVIEDGDRVSGVDGISFANSNFQNSASHLGGHSRIVTLNSTAQLDDSVRNTGCKGYSPNDQRKNNRTNRGDDAKEFGSIRSGRIACLFADNCLFFFPRNFQFLLFDHLFLLQAEAFLLAL